MKAIINADVFDGRHSELRKNVSIIIDENTVREIVAGDISEDQFEQIIDARGKTVIPGLTDSHVHLSSSPYIRDGARVDEKAIGGVINAKEILMRGFTTVRDAGGITYGLKQAIDKGYIDGPRIFPSNAYISQTCGHGDFRTGKNEKRITDGLYASANLSNGDTALVDGPDEVLRAVREQLFLKASQIKIMAGGGVASMSDPIETVQFTFEEMKAAVDAAADYGTYVMAHLYTSKAIQRAAKAGVRSFEHGQLMDEETAKILAERGAFIDPCPNFVRRPPDRIYHNPISRQKYELVKKGEVSQTELINKYQLKLLYGTDSVELQLLDLPHYRDRFGNFEALVSATGNVNDLIALTTYQNPYPDGKIGVLEEGAFADLLIVEGNPVINIEVLTDVDNLKVIMKDGKIYKNTI